MTKLSTGLPEGDANGLASIVHDLVAEPHKPHLVIAVLDCKSITTDADSGATVPTARIRQIEPVGGIDRDLAVQIMRRALEERTGQAVLPIELEDELSELLGHLDPETGEITDPESED